MAIFIKFKRLFSPIRLLNLVFISFICEKLCSTEAVETGILKQTLKRVLRVVNMVYIVSMSLFANPLS